MADASDCIEGLATAELTCCQILVHRLVESPVFQLARLVWEVEANILRAL